ncbi:MAG: hypothetical protein AB1742_08050 [bacterium]
MAATLRFFMRLFVAAHVSAPVVLALAISGPLLLNDYSTMIYQQHKAVEFFGESRSLWGYDPFYSAGYPLSFIWNSSAVLQFLSLVFHPAREHVVLLVATAASVAMAPAMFWLGLGNFGLKGGKRAAAVILAIAAWWTGLPAVFMLIGMPSALMVFHLSFYLVSLFYRYFIERDERVLALLYALTPMCFLAHKTAIVTIGVPLMILLASSPRAINARRFAHLLLIGGLVLAVNSFWLIPFLKLLDYRVFLPDAPHGLCYDPLRIFKDYFTLSKIMGHRVIEADKDTFLLLFVNTVLKNALLFLGSCGVVTWWRRGRRSGAAFFALFTALFLALIYFGSFWRPASLAYPTRYIGYLDSMLAVPAGAFIGFAWERFKVNSLARRAAPVIAAPALAVLLAASAAPFLFFTRELASRLDDDTVALSAFLQRDAVTAGRVMLEDSGWNDRDGSPPKYGKSQFPSLISDLTGTEFIGGPYPYVFLAHHYADFHDGKFLGKPLESYRAQVLYGELDRYGVRRIVCWSGECKKVFSAPPDEFRRLKTVGRFTIFERARFEYKPFLAGEGYVVADARGIRCYRVRPDGGRAVLKYHAMKELTTFGKGVVGAAASGDDPVGFIEIADPEPYFRIIVGY